MLKNIFVICTFVAAAYGDGLLTVLTAPEHALRFSGNEPVDSDVVCSLLPAALGYSIEKSNHWGGLTILSPFVLPVVTVAVSSDIELSIDSSKLASYPVSGNGHDSLDCAGARVEAHNGQFIDADFTQGIEVLSQEEFVKQFGNIEPKTEKLSGTLSKNKEIAEVIAAFKGLTEALTANNLPALINVRISLASLAGDRTAQDEARKLVSDVATKFVQKVQELAKDKVLILSYNSKDESIVKRTRRAATANADPVPEDINLAKTYSEDYPVIFNIILWFGVVIAFSLLAISYAIASMDPGKDSIIYRMTSTRMKKDN